MDRQIISFFEKHQLKLKNARFVIAVSTGVDSMTLLYSFLLLKEEYQLELNVAHFNHQKRKQSAEEEAFILEFCRHHEIGCYTDKLEPCEKENFQSYAREKRYEFFQRVMDKTGSDYLALGHHALDNMETILMRMIRGSNLKGYSGMDEIVSFHGKMMIRPFLAILKEDLIVFAKMHKICYYQDASNSEDIYTRNRIRKEIIPLLFKEEKNVHQKFQEFSEMLKEANRLLLISVQAFLKEKAKVSSECVTFEKTEFLSLSHFLQTEVLFHILEPYSLSKANIQEIIKLIVSKKTNLKVIFKERFTFVKEYDQIYLFHKVLTPLKTDIVIDRIGIYKINDTISVNVSKKCGAIIPNTEDLCYNTTMLPIRIRNRKNGDKILLDSGYKKVKDLLIDLKIGIITRENILIAEKNDEILAVLGIKKSRILKQVEKNDIVIKVEYENG